MSSEKFKIFLVLDSGELAVVTDTEPENTYIVRNPKDQTIDIIKSGEGRKGFLASRIANRLRHEERGMRYRIRVVEPDERYIYLEMMKDKFGESFSTITTISSSTSVTAQSMQSTGAQMTDPEDIPKSPQIEQELAVSDFSVTQKTQESQDVQKSEEQALIDAVIPKMKLESEILELITHLCAAYLLGVNKSALLSAVANKTLTEKQRNSIRKVLLTKIDDFLCSV